MEDRKSLTECPRFWAPVGSGPGAVSIVWNHPWEGKTWFPGVKDQWVEPQILSRVQLALPDGKDWWPHEGHWTEWSYKWGNCIARRIAFRGRTRIQVSWVLPGPPRRGNQEAGWGNSFEHIDPRAEKEETITNITPTRHAAHLCQVLPPLQTSPQFSITGFNLKNYLLNSCLLLKKSEFICSTCSFPLSPFLLILPLHCLLCSCTLRC